MSPKDSRKAHVSKFNTPIKKKKTKLAKLKTSSWYEGAARSVGIAKGRPRDKRER